jgi:hypothetical protein
MWFSAKAATVAMLDRMIGHSMPATPAKSPSRGYFPVS